MDNRYAWRLGEAAAKARPGGDYIDHGWSLVKELHARGFDIVPRVRLPQDWGGKTINEMCGLKPPGEEPKPAETWRTFGQKVDNTG